MWHVSNLTPASKECPHGYSLRGSSRPPPAALSDTDTAPTTPDRCPSSPRFLTTRRAMDSPGAQGNSRRGERPGRREWGRHLCVCFRHAHLGHRDPKLAGRLRRGHEDVHAAPEACRNPVFEDKSPQPFHDHALAEGHPEGMFHIP